MNASHSDVGLCAKDGEALGYAAAFEWVRPYFPAQRACLLDSLALIDAMAVQGCAADWIFGVRLQPFGAHCWVQHRGVVLNDELEHVALFVPILWV